MKNNFNYKICPECDYFCRVEEADIFCPYCGVKLIDKCPNCGREIPNPYGIYCKYCGALYPGKSKKLNKNNT